MRIAHPFPPLYDARSRVLILGSFPSVKSREGNFFYHHPQNRFWRVMAAIFDAPAPETLKEKTALLLENGVALWDVVADCEIVGSSDASIRDAEPTDLQPILEAAAIRAIFCNGAVAWTLYQKKQLARTGVQAVRLPSTSPANAAWSIPRLVEAWRVVREVLERG